MTSLFTTLLFALAILPRPTESGASIDNLSWLTGSWRLESGGKVIEEQWTAPAGGMMLGMSRTVVAGKTVSFEYLRIVQRGDDFVYIAQPEGNPPTEFRLAGGCTEECVFSNPQHDFPKRIRYRRHGDNGVTASIEDETGKKKIEFSYTRVRMSRSGAAYE